MTILGFFRLGTKNKKREKTRDERDREMETEYYRIIDNCANKEEDFTIRNNDNKHVIYVLKTLFKYAKKEVCIFTDRIKEEIFNDKYLIDEAITFLKKPEARLKIAYNDINLSKEGVLSGEFARSILNSESKGEVEIWDASKICFPDGNHFFLNDRFGFRYEIKPRNAVANFGDKINSEKLFAIFARIIAKSDKILG